MRFLFYTDSHLTGQTPRHRIDEYPQTLNIKLHEVYQIAREESCEFVAFGGDYFDSHRIFNYNVISEAMDAVGDCPVKTYAVIGEHDLYGHNPTTFSSSTLAFFAKRCPKMVILNEPVSVSGVNLFPKHEWQPMAEALGYAVDKTQLNILICHELISDRPAMFEVVLTSSLKSPYDLIVSGDLHCGFASHKANGTWFCNPGSLARKAINEAKRFPQVAIIDIEKGSAPKIELRRLKSGKEGSLVFGESLAEIAREHGAFEENTFAEEMLGYEADSANIHELIQISGKAKGIRKEVLDYLATKKEGDKT